MVKGEPFDVLKILRVLGIAIVMFYWYPHDGTGGSVLGVLAYIPNCIGSYTHDLYEIEAAQVQAKFDELHQPLKQRQDSIDHYMAVAKTTVDGMNKAGVSDITGRLVGNHLCAANPFGNADYIRATHVGIQYIAQVGKRLGEMDNEVYDRAFLRCYVILRWLLCVAFVRYRAEYSV